MASAREETGVGFDFGSGADCWAAGEAGRFDSDSDSDSASGVREGNEQVAYSGSGHVGSELCQSKHPSQIGWHIFSIRQARIEPNRSGRPNNDTTTKRLAIIA